MPNHPRVLVADDEARFAEALRQGLERHGFAVHVVHDGEAALAQAGTGSFDLLLLDLMLPRLSGYRVVEQLRAADVQIPIIMLTAKDGEYDEADAFDLGADDYLTKPFSTVVLLARMTSLLRRRSDVRPSSIQAGRLLLEPRKHLCTVDGQRVALTAREYAALLFLAERAGEVVSKQQLLDEVWDDPALDVNAVEVCIGQVRRKIGSGLIDTVRGVGYRVPAP